MLPGRIDLISSSDVQFPFGSLETLQVLAGNLLSIPSSFTEVPIHLDLASEDNSDSNTTAGAREFYFTASVWSLDSSLAPPACVLPSLSTVYPGQNASKLERDITIIRVLMIALFNRLVCRSACPSSLLWNGHSFHAALCNHWH